MTSTPIPDLDVAVDDRLGRVIEEVERVAARAGGPSPGDRADALARAAVETLRLDGSPIERPMDVPPDQPAGSDTGPARGGWLQVLRSGAEGLADVPDDVVLALEHRGALAGLAADDLVPTIRGDLVASLAALHARMTDGLLAPDVAGRPRRSDQAVHDASLGRVLFFPVDPAHVVARLGALADWLAATDAHPVVAAGVVHHQLLDVHPYEAANGRLARTAARLVLRAAGLDADGAARPESSLLQDPIGYLDDVARARRLRSPAAFVERTAEAVADGLRVAAGPSPVEDVPAATARFVAELGSGRDFTVSEHRSAAGGADADRGLVLAADAGLVRRVLGTRGLRWRTN